MAHPILGLHHVTATADLAQADLTFSAGVLGLRLVKRTVNFDNHNVYHFYYGNETGTPGTIWTTFPYQGWGVPPGAPGAGQIHVTSFSIPAGSLDFWKVRLRAHGVPAADVEPRFGQESIVATDPSGLQIELVASEGDARPPWKNGGVDSDHAIRGLHSITMVVRSPEPTIALMTGLLGYRVVNESERRIRLAVNGDAAGHLIDVVSQPDARPGRNGLGTVHHVAMAIATPEEQLQLREELVRLGVQVTPVMDRQYFRSIYFREPGGVLFEVATIPPGFTVDEALPCLGVDLKLPPWEEPHRAAIEAGLPSVESPRQA